MSKKPTQNQYKIVESYAIFNVSHGRTFKIDIEDLDKITSYHWYINEKGYVVTMYHDNGKRHSLRLHRLIMGCPNDMVVDHINHDITDNRKCNLRVCTQDENMRNRKPDRNSKSGIKGVYPENGKWRVMINYNRKQYRLGTFSDIQEAIKVRQEAEARLYGAYANLQDTGGLL